MELSNITTKIAMIRKFKKRYIGACMPKQLTPVDMSMLKSLIS